jgi:hypothetical protein
MTAEGFTIPRHEPASTLRESRRSNFGDGIRTQFKQLMERLTRSVTPKLKTRKGRSEEGVGGFRMVANTFARWAVKATQIPPVMWDPLSWLSQWEFDDSAAIKEFYSDSARPGSAHESVDLSPRL